MNDVPEAASEDPSWERLYRTYEDIFDAIDDPIYIHEPHGNFRDVNTTAVERMGYSVDEFRELEPTDLDAGGQADRAHERIERILEMGQYTFETVHATKEGEEIPVEVAASTIEYFGDEAVLSVARDISERKERERELEARAKVMEGALDGMAILDENECYIDVNQAHADVYGYEDPDAFLGNSWRMCYSEQEVERFESDIMPQVQTEGSWRGMATGLRADGEEFPQELSLSSLADGRIVCVVRDATDRVEREQRLEEQRDSLQVLNQVLRHDIRNNLQVVTAYADMLTDEVESETYLEKIQENARHAVELTRTARDMADVMLSEPQSPEEVNLRPLLTDVLDDARAAHPEAVITQDGPLPDVTILANDMLGSVFHNLIENAIQHNDSDVPHVWVSATVEDAIVEVSVADNGPGIPDARKETIFGKGEKGLDSTGAGLGLYLVESIVEISDGDIRVEDNDPEGAVFTVTLHLA